MTLIIISYRPGTWGIPQKNYPDVFSPFQSFSNFSYYVKDYRTNLKLKIQAWLSILFFKVDQSDINHITRQTAFTVYKNMLK